jgi:hypothetical protein
MSGERSVDVEKINNNEKGFEPAHIPYTLPKQNILLS